jgi:uncharacterized protein YgbK (DUF1537 family)
MLPPDRLLYKKIDSTLRGPLGIEIATLLDYSAADAALVVPALPAQGRGLLDGRLVVHDVAHELHLPRTLHQQTGRKIDHIDIRSVRAGATLLRGTIEQQIVPGGIIVVDATEEHDLSAIAAAISEVRARLMLAGSAGLAAWLPSAWRLGQRSVLDTVPGTTARPILYVLGSPNPRTRAQIDVLRREVVAIEVEPGTRLEQAGSIIQSATTLLHNGLDVALVLTAHDGFRVETVEPALQQAVAQSLATIAGQIMEQTFPGGLLLGGGDIAFAVCRELGIRTITLEGEGVPGLPFGRATTPDGRDLRMITKAGGFGTSAALLAAREVLHGREWPA